MIFFNYYIIIIKMKTILIFDKFWTIDDVNNNTNYLFIFGDNDIQKGKRGQAIIRDLPNTIGIPTKKLPTLHHDAFYTDNEYKNNIKKIDLAIYKIIKKFLKNKNKYTTLVIPKDGFGTGLAQLKTKAPKTFLYIENKINALIALFS
jgi:hypothetical protein